MPRLTFAIVFIAAATAWIACTDHDPVFVENVGRNPDVITFTGGVDTVFLTTTDTVPRDTVVITRRDTVLAAGDSVFIVTVVDTIQRPQGDTIITVVDTVVAVDTVRMTVEETIVLTQVDTVTIHSTVVETQTFILVDSVLYSRSLAPSVVSPVNLEVGDTLTIVAVTQNTLGFPSNPQQLTWLSEDPSIASVLPSIGRVTAHAMGQTRIIATAPPLSATILATVEEPAAPPPPPNEETLDSIVTIQVAQAQGLWPNLPAGLMKMTDFDISNEPLGEPVHFAFFSRGNDWRYAHRNDIAEVIADPGAPSGRGKSLRARYPASRINERDPDGNAWSESAVVQWTVPDGGAWPTEGYFGFIMKWSPNWVDHQLGDKVAFWFNAGGSGQSFTSNRRRTVSVFNSAIGAHDAYLYTYEITHGTWYMWEWYQQRPSSLPGTGRVRLWITPWTGSGWGQTEMVLNFTRTFSVEERRWRLMELSGTYGGASDPDLTSDQFLYWDAATVWMR